jgi:hypothetical protein
MTFSLPSKLKLVFAAAATIMFAGSAQAATVLSSDPAPSSYEVTGRARWGATGFEGVLFTPATPGPAGSSLNPSGAPVWQLGQSYDFALNYVSASGLATWSIDFNRDGDFLDSQESTSVASGLAGKGFTYVNLFAQGNVSGANSNSVTVNNFTVNGTNFGTFASTSSTATNRLLEDSTGQFSDILATGSLVFGGNGAFSSERPRVWVQLGGAADLQAAVPEPSTWAMMILGFAGVAFMAYRRKIKPASIAA